MVAAVIRPNCGVEKSITKVLVSRILAAIIKTTSGWQSGSLKSYILMAIKVYLPIALTQNP